MSMKWKLPWASIVPGALNFNQYTNMEPGRAGSDARP
jgi:hypothetical protein